MPVAKEATLVEIRNYFGLTAKELMAQWKLLTDQDKEDLKVGIGSGSLTY